MEGYKNLADAVVVCSLITSLVIIALLIVKSLWNHWTTLHEKRTSYIKHLEFTLKTLGAEKNEFYLSSTQLKLENERLSKELKKLKHTLQGKMNQKQLENDCLKNELKVLATKLERLLINKIHKEMKPSIKKPSAHAPKASPSPCTSAKKRIGAVFAAKSRSTSSHLLTSWFNSAKGLFAMASGVTPVKK